MQIAIPRTSEVGNVQNHLMQKPVYDQEALAAKAIEQKDRQLRQTEKVDDPSSALIRDDQRRGSKGKRERGSPQTGKAKPGGKPATDPSGHPYKGQHIDFTL